MIDAKTLRAKSRKRYKARIKKEYKFLLKQIDKEIRMSNSNPCCVRTIPAYRTATLLVMVELKRKGFKYKLEEANWNVSTDSLWIYW